MYVAFVDFSKAYDFPVISTHFALKSIEEITGIPQHATIMVAGQEKLCTIWSMPDILRSLYERSEECYKKTQLDKRPRMVIWLLDDSHLLSPIHMSQLYETLTERSIKGHKLPDNVAIVLAGNDGSSMAGAKIKFSAIINRIWLMKIRADFNYWKKEFALKNHIHPAVISFLNQDHYQRFFHEPEQVDSAWASPRSWSRFSNMLVSWEAKNKKIATEIILLSMSHGTIGSDASSHFTTYYKIYSKFKVNEIVAAYKTFEVPKDPMDQYALAYAIINYYVGNTDRNTLITAISHIIGKYLENLPDIGIIICKELLSMVESIGKKQVANTVLRNLHKNFPNLLTNVIKETVDL